MSMTLFFKTLKRNYKLFIIFYAVLAMYLVMMASMFDPNDIDALMSMLELMPSELLNAMGFAGIVTNLVEYLASWLYGMLMVGFPLVYCIILGNRLVAKMVDDGSFSFLLSTPLSRTKIIITQGVYALVSVFALFTLVFATGVGVCAMMLPGSLDVHAFFLLNLTTMLLNMAVIMITFFFSCLFSDAKYSVGLGSGVTIMFLLMNMLGGASADARILKDLSIYGLYDPLELVRGQSMLWINLFFIGMIVVLFAAGILIFRKKQLTI